MSAFSTKGVTIALSPGSATPIELSPTGITASAAAGGNTIITVANTLAVGDVVVFPPTTGFKALNSKSFPVRNPTATQFEVSADTFGSTEVMATGLAVKVYKKADLINLCLGEFTIAAASVSDISVGTYCEPGAVIPGTSQAGSITLTGFVDPNDVGYMELVKAGEDGIASAIDITLPGTLGHLIGVISLSEMSFSVPLSGAVGFSITGSQTSPLKYVQ
jgi:hypothetical protein